MGAGDRDFKELSQEIELKTGGLSLGNHIQEHHAKQDAFEEVRPFGFSLSFPHICHFCRVSCLIPCVLITILLLCLPYGLISSIGGTFCVSLLLIILLCKWLQIDFGR
jgi:hypothetical protein